MPERVRELQLPSDQLVVIGSGVLDALGLRVADDVDLVVSASLFAQLAEQPDWRMEAKHKEVMLRHEDIEVFLSWGSEGRPNFDELYAQGLTVDDIRFAHPQTVIDWKKQRGSEKDMRDIALLTEYMHEHDF